MQASQVGLLVLARKHDSSYPLLYIQVRFHINIGSLCHCTLLVSKSVGLLDVLGRLFTSKFILHTYSVSHNEDVLINCSDSEATVRGCLCLVLAQAPYKSILIVLCG